jgi:hypothetical protein
LLRQRPHLRGIVSCGAWSAMGLSAFTRVAHAGLDPLTAHIPFELHKHCEEASKGASCRCREIKGLRQRDKAHAHSCQFVQRRHEVDEGAPPAVELPDQNDIELALLGSQEQRPENVR